MLDAIAKDWELGVVDRDALDGSNDGSKSLDIKELAEGLSRILDAGSEAVYEAGGTASEFGDAEVAWRGRKLGKQVHVIVGIRRRSAAAI